MDDQVSYDCPSCGEEIVTPVDVTQGRQQEYVEDCPICCRAIILRIEIRGDEVSCRAALE